MKILNIISYLFGFLITSNAYYLNTYTIENNDTCIKIIKEFNIDNETFYEMNPKIDCNMLEPGDNITLFNNNTMIINKDKCKIKK